MAGCTGRPAIDAPFLPGSVAITPIHDVQGSGGASPLAGQTVTIAGIVTGDFQAGDSDVQQELGGFFLQEENPDADPGTSDGLFVADGDTTDIDVAVGDRVSAKGTIVEHFGETRMIASSVTVSGTGAIQATDLRLPAATTFTNSDGLPVADLERYEGMLVTVPQLLFTNDLYNLERFGEIGLSQGGRLYQYTNGSPPDVAGQAAHQRQTAARSLIMDDGQSARNPGHSVFLQPDSGLPRGYSVRSGDSILGLTGNIRYSRGSGASGIEAYRLEPTVHPQILSVNMRAAVPPDPGGSVKVASFNVLNFFTTIDDGQDDCGPSGDFGCRGADSPEEFERQRAKLINTLLLLDADVVGLMELENNDSAALGNLVAGLNAVAGNGTWSYINTGTVGTDAITCGLIFKTASIRPVGAFATLTHAVDARFIDWRNRPAIAQTFAAVANDARFTVVVNHLKSKGSPCNDLDDPDRGDGQGNCNGTRFSAVLALLDWLATDPTGSGDPDILVVGDMNAYLAEDPVTAFERAGYANLPGDVLGEKAYSFVYAGQAGALDHAFASPALAAQVAGIAEWHINADEPPVLDYNLDFGRDAGWFDAAIPFRTSDHDPVIVGLNPEQETGQ